MTSGVFWVGAALYGLIVALLVVTPRVSSPQYRYGVHLPSVARADPALATADHAYRIGVGFAALAAAPFVALGAAPGWSWAAVAAPFVALAVGFGGYLTARREVFRIKSRAGWSSTGPRVAVAELRPSHVDHTWPAWTLLPLAVWVFFLVWGITVYPSLPASIPTHFNGNGVPDTYSPTSIGTAFFVTVVGAAVLGIFVALAAGITRARAPLDAARPRTDAERQFQFRYQGVRGLLVFGAFVQATLGLSGAETWGVIPTSAAGGLIPLIPTFVGTVILLAFFLRLGQLGSRIPMPPEAEGAPLPAVEPRTARDDDAAWAGGVLYHNREDSALLVPRRYGVGWTLNWGNPWSWVIIVALAAVPFVLLLVVPHR